MNKKFLLSLLSIVIICLFVFSAFGCTTKQSNEEAFQILKSALASSLAKETFYWTERYAEEGSGNSGDEGYIPAYQSYVEVNVQCDFDERSGELFYDENGNLRNHRMRTYLEKDGLKKLLYVAPIAEKGGAFYTLRREEYASDNSKNITYSEPMTFIQYKEKHSEEYYSITLAKKLRELQLLEFEDLNFDLDKRIASTKGKVSTIGFKVKDSYFEKFALSFPGETSVFSNSDAVVVETAYDKISSLVCNRFQETATSWLWKTELEIYKFEVVYYGPYITKNMPRLSEFPPRT